MDGLVERAHAASNVLAKYARGDAQLAPDDFRELSDLFRELGDHISDRDAPPDWEAISRKWHEGWEATDFPAKRRRAAEEAAQQEDFVRRIASDALAWEVEHYPVRLAGPVLSFDDDARNMARFRFSPEEPIGRNP